MNYLLFMIIVRTIIYHVVSRELETTYNETIKINSIKMRLMLSTTDKLPSRTEKIQNRRDVIQWSILKI